MTFSAIQHWIDQSVDVWQLFGYFNVLASTTLLLLLGFQRGWQRSQWTLLVSTFAFGTGIGTMVIPSITGALLGGILFFSLVKRLLQFKHPTADLFAIYIIVFIGVGRLGCMFSGCCFGTVTELPWGISYGVGNLAHWLHFHTAQIADLNGNSLPVHPVQLYESMFLLLGALPLALYAQHRKTSGRVILSGFVAAYFLQRFVLEFFRDMSNVWWSEVYWGPISVFQVFLLLVSLGSFAYLAYATRNPYSFQRRSQFTLILPPSTPVVILSALLAGTALFSNHFQKIQLVLLFLLLSGSILAQIEHYLSTQKRLDMRLSPFVAGGFALILLFNTNTFFSGFDQNQTPVLQKSTWLFGINNNNQKLIRIGNQNLKFSDYSRVSNLLRNEGDPLNIDSTHHSMAMLDFETPRISYALGGSYAALEFERSGCGGDVYTEKVKSNSFMAVMNRDRSRGQRWATYINGRFEYSSGTLQTDDEPERPFKYTFGVINTGLEAELIGAGIGVGVAGNRSLDFDEYALIPSAYLRFGPREFHIEAGFNDRYYVEPGFLNMHFNLGHKSTRGRGYQIGFGNRGPLPLATLGTYATITNLQLGNLPKADLSFHILGENDGFATTLMFRFPRHSRAGY